MVKAEEKTNLMASTWTPAAVVRRKFKAGPRRKTSLEMDVERAFLECRILYTELRDAMLEAGIKTAANDVSVGLVLMTPWDAKDRFVKVLPVGGNMEALAEQARKADLLEKRDCVFPIGVAFWQRDRTANQDEAWVRMWRIDGNSALALAEVHNALCSEKGNEFELEL
jgi:hypothetical protein